MQKLLRFSLTLLVCVLAGCRSAQPQLKTVSSAVLPMRQASAQEIAKRCARLRALLAPLSVREIGFSHRAYAGFDPAELCRFIAESGFNRICLQLSSPAELNDDLENFLKAAKERKLAVDVMLEQTDFRQFDGKFGLMRNFRDPDPELADMVRALGGFNSGLPESCARISKVIVSVAPHKFVSDTQGSTGQLFAWSAKSYGPGLDNDMLMLQTLQMLAELKPDGMELAAAVPDFYHELAVEGKITRGRIGDFSACRKGKGLPVILLSTGNKPSQVVSGSKNEFASAGSGEVVLGIELAGHTSHSAGKLRRRDWHDLARILDYVIRQHQKYPAFRGVMLMPLPILQYLIMEQD